MSGQVASTAATHPGQSGNISLKHRDDNANRHRRRGHQLQVQGERPVFRVGDLSVGLVRRIVKLGGKDVKLSPKECELLRALVQRAGKVLTHKFCSANYGTTDRCAVSAGLCAAS
jgi:DNA-binding response OmpR family regulator